MHSFEIAEHLIQEITTNYYSKYKYNSLVKNTTTHINSTLRGKSSMIFKYKTISKFYKKVKKKNLKFFKKIRKLIFQRNHLLQPI